MRHNDVRESVSLRSGAASSVETVVSERLWVRVLMWVGFPVFGAGAGWVLKSVAGWVVSLPWAPLQGPFELVQRLISTFGEPQASVGALALGAVAGLVLAFIAEQEMLAVTVSNERVRMKRGESSTEVERSAAGSIFLDGGELVLLGRSGEELSRERTDLDADRLRDAFLTHGFPWLAADPYADDYRLWVEETPDLPAGANALLTARARALAKGSDGGEDAAVLRSELSRMSVVVREDGERQYWRRVGPYSQTG